MKDLGKTAGLIYQSLEKILYIFITENKELFENKQNNIILLKDIKKKLRQITPKQLNYFKRDLKQTLKYNLRDIRERIIKGENIINFCYYFDFIKNINFLLFDFEANENIFYSSIKNFIDKLIFIFNKYDNNIDVYNIDNPFYMFNYIPVDEQFEIFNILKYELDFNKSNNINKENIKKYYEFIKKNVNYFNYFNY